MTAKTGESILRNHSLPIVGNANQFPPALLYVHSDLPCARVQRVLHKFLYDRSRALDHLAGCDAVGDVVREDSNFHKGNLATKKLSAAPPQPKYLLDCGRRAAISDQLSAFSLA